MRLLVWVEVPASSSDTRELPAVTVPALASGSRRVMKWADVEQAVAVV